MACHLTRKAFSLLVSSNVAADHLPKEHIMQMSNGAIRHGSTPQLPNGGNLPALAKSAPEIDLDSFDLSDFVVTSSKSTKTVRTTAKTREQVEVEKFMKESSELFELGIKYEKEVVQRGHQALYELLASIYNLALRIEENEQATKIVAAIRKDLKDNHDIKLQSNVTPMAAVVRFVVRQDKVASSRYAKVLEIARQENLPAEELPAYISRRGGVTQIQDTEANQLAKKGGEKNSKERMELMREYFTLVGQASKQSFTYEGAVVAHEIEKISDAKVSEFCVFVAHHVGDAEYKMINANDLGRSYEDNLLRFIGKDLPNDPYVLERGLRNFKRKLSMDESQPEGFRQEMVRQLAKPMKYKETAVIEMDMPEVEAE
jgi:hypothetical protein